ncbi:MAG TPA: hypothetical protein VHZ74_14425 [Bryobacteraceae bacterium]|nr:hypothetical protein [Bryobacteraceae bacterium]
MRLFAKGLLPCAALLFTSLSYRFASAQWIKYPTAGVPRDKSGKPNLAAPSPRTAGGKPDFSGMWMIADALPCPKMLTDDLGECLEKNPIGQITADLNAAVPGGLPLRPRALEIRKQRQTTGLDPHVKCLPSSFPRMFTLPHITKFVQTPALLILANEFNASYRQIFLDGRPLPVDPQPSWNGYSTARWDGNTLVVETNGFRDDLWMDMAGTPLTSTARVTERFRRPVFGTLEIDATVDDPTVYTHPWSFKIVDKLVVDTELIDEICLENEKSSKHMAAHQAGR